jgi:hypothetical protein
VYNKFHLYDINIEGLLPLLTYQIVTATVENRVQELDIAEGLKQLLLDAGFTVESVTPKQLG